MDYSRIKIELERKNISVRDLCDKIDITEQGLHQMIRKKSMKVEVLERISNVLRLPVSFWFEDTTNISNTKYVNTITNDNTRKQMSSKFMYEKIDSLTNDLKEVLKEVIFR